MKAPLFSVVIPCYNAQHTLRETVRSVLAQTLADWELLIVDNGSRWAGRWYLSLHHS